jgi:hypothetical protein
VVVVVVALAVETEDVLVALVEMGLVALPAEISGTEVVLLLEVLAFGALVAVLVLEGFGDGFGAGEEVVELSDCSCFVAAGDTP